MPARRTGSGRSNRSTASSTYRMVYRGKGMDATHPQKYQQNTERLIRSRVLTVLGKYGLATYVEQGVQRETHFRLGFGRTIQTIPFGGKLAQKKLQKNHH